VAAIGPVIERLAAPADVARSIEFETACSETAVAVCWSLVSCGRIPTIHA
jgi:hypothetical protein